jgi:hypothetical protein
VFCGPCEARLARYSEGLDATAPPHYGAAMRATALALAMLFGCACAAPTAAPGPTPTPSESPTPSPSPSPSPSPTPVPTQASAAAYFVPSGSYAYIALPAAVEAQALAGLQTDEIKVFAKSSAVRSVTKAGEPLGAAVLVIGVDESFAALPNAFDGFVNGFTTGAGSALMTQRQNTTIGGRPVVLMFQTDQKLWYAVWQQRVFFVSAFAATQAAAEEVATALITANTR